jgi:glucosamine 6-phosphate synthetase-like amidotransferase/phosphosugar isomerase protein
VVGKSSDPAVNFLLEGLHILQNRGYDSAGISTLHSDPKYGFRFTNCFCAGW